MTQSPFYCSEMSRRFSEKTYGTASVGDAWLLVEYPFWWGPKALSDSKLSPEVKEHIARAVESVRRARLLFIKRDRHLGDELSIFVVRCRESGSSIVRLGLTNHDHLLDFDLARLLSGDAAAANVGEAFAQPLYLVCTHGRRDKCCAKFGYPVFKALRKYKGDSVWQSSHVGGDRFAANLVCFPDGLFHAHVSEEASARIVDEYERGRLVLEFFRGRACYPYPVQAAEYFVRAESGLTGVGALRRLDGARLAESVWRVRFAAADDAGKVYEATVAARPSAFRSYNTCHAATEKRVVQYALDDYRVEENDER